MTTSPRSGAIVVSWKDLPRWDFKTARAAAFRLSHPSFRPLGDFIEEATELVRPSEQPDKEWPVFGVTNKDGVVFSHYQKGFDFNAPYKRIKQDWFFHNPTRANVGSLGRVPAVPPDALTSPEYQVWRIQKGLLPEYVEILIQTSFFIELIDFHRVGAVKERLFTWNLMEIPIPVLSESKQLKVISRWQQNRVEIAEAQRRKEMKEAEIPVLILAELGIPFRSEEKFPKAFSLLWKDLERWNVNYLARITLGAADIRKAKYPLRLLGEIAQVSYGIQKSPANRPGQNARPYLRVANVQRGELDLSEIKYFEVSSSELEVYRLQRGDLLVCEGNSADLVGRPAIWNDEIPDCVHQNHILKVRVNPRYALPEFVLEYMQTSPVRNYFRARAKFTTNLASINSNDLRELQIPLPSLELQRKILQEVKERRREIAREQKNIHCLASVLEEEIEEMILGTRPVPEINDQQKLSA